MAVLIVDFPLEPDVERAVLPGVEVQSLAAQLGHSPSMDELLQAVGERRPAVLITFYGQYFKAGFLGALARAGVRGLICASVGYDHVDVAAAHDAGLTICNVPDYGTEEVADQAMALLLWCLRGLPAASSQSAPPTLWWNSQRFAGVRRLRGATLALLGFGRIGQAVAHRAQAFGLSVRWYDPYIVRGQDKVTRTARVESVQELLRGADALSIHCLLSPETRGMIDAVALALLPSHAVLVNTARGPLVNEQALLEALRTGALAAAALDVLTVEPPQQDGLFAAYLRGELPTLLLTPHAAWYSQQSLVELRGKAAMEAGRVLRGEQPFNPLPRPRRHEH